MNIIEEIEALKNNETTYFIDYQTKKTDSEYEVPKWVRHPNATIKDVMEVVRATHFNPIENLRIRDEKTLDEFYDEGVTYRTHYFGERYQRTHETFYECAGLDYEPVREKAKENYIAKINMIKELQELEVQSA